MAFLLKWNVAKTNKRKYHAYKTENIILKLIKDGVQFKKSEGIVMEFSGKKIRVQFLA